MRRVRILSKLKKVAPYLIGLIILAVIFYRLDWTKLGEVFLKTDPLWLVLGLSMTLLVVFIRSWRWNYFKKAQGMRYSLKDSFLMHGVSLLAGFITPGRLGEFSKVVYLKKDGYSYGRAAVSVIMDRLFDVFFLLSYLVLGAWIFLESLRETILIVGLSLLAAFLILLFLKNIFKVHPLASLSSFFVCLLPEKYRKLCGAGLQNFFGDLRKLTLENYARLIILTFLVWTAYYTQMFVLAKSLGIGISFFFLAFAVTAAGIITMIPVSYSGLGTRDLILVASFSLVFLPPESAVALSTLIFSTLVIAALWGWFCWLKKPLVFK